MRTAVLKNKKCLFVLPCSPHVVLLPSFNLTYFCIDVAIVNEKVNQLEEFGRRLGFRVDGYYGSEGLLPPSPGNHIIIATIEKVPSTVYYV